MASDDSTSIRLELLQASVVDDKSMVCLAGFPRPSARWGTKSVADIDAQDLEHWNAPFARDAFEFYVTVAGYKPEAVEYVVDNDRLVSCVSGKWKLVELGFSARSICRLGSDLFAIGAADELGVLRKSKWAKLNVATDGAEDTKSVAANVGSRIIAGTESGTILELTAVGRKYRWAPVGKVDGALFAVAGVHAEKIFVGGASGVYYHDSGRWRQVMRGFHGHVSHINTLPTGEVLAGTSTGELWAGSVDGMKQVASDVTDKTQISAVVRFRDTIFVAGRRVVRQGQRGFEPVELSGFVPRLSASGTPTLHVVGERLWVVGPFGIWSSEDGQVFAPLKWR